MKTISARMSGREVAQSKRSTSRTKTQRAGIIFPVSRVLRFMRAGPFFKYRIAAGAPVYMAAVMEYLCAEVCTNRKHPTTHKHYFKHFNY